MGGFGSGRKKPVASASSVSTAPDVQPEPVAGQIDRQRKVDAMVKEATEHKPPKPKAIDRRGLTPYQRKWTTLPRYDLVTGKAKTKTLVKARRVGGTHAAAVDAMNMAAGVEPRPTGFFSSEPMNVYLVSRSMEQAQEFIREVADLAESIMRFDRRFGIAPPHKQSVEFINTGCRVQALPCKGSSIRGYTGAVALDEFVFYERPDEVYAAAKLVAAPNLREPRGYPVSFITTPWASGTFAYRMFTDPELPFDRMVVDIYKAKEQGFPIDIEQTRRECALEEIFRVEYCCEWLHGGGAFFDLENLTSACRGHTPDGFDRLPSYIGIDIGRTHDLTAAVDVRKDGEDRTWVARVLSLRGMNFDDQIQRLDDFIRGCRATVIKIDQGLMGAPVRDALERLHPGKVWGINMTTAEQEALAVETRSALDRGYLRIFTGRQPDEMRALTTELVSIRARPTDGHKTRFETPRDQTGHGDRAWACMLGVSACGGTSYGLKLPPSVYIRDFEGQSIHMASDQANIYDDVGGGTYQADEIVTMQLRRWSRVG